MSEKKKITLLAIVVIILIVTILWIILGGKAESESDNQVIKVTDTKNELQQDAEEFDNGATNEEAVKESTADVIELPFIPID